MAGRMMLAEQAADYVANTVRIKTGNRWEGINRTPDAVTKEGVAALVREKRQFARDLYGHWIRKEGAPAGTRTEAKARSMVASRFGVGNCTEQSAIAFEWLMNRGEQGIAWIEFPDHDHMFTLLGLHAAPAQDETFRMRQSSPASWSPTAVVCDPWYHEWFRIADDWNRKIGQILRESSGSAIADGTVIRVHCRAYV